MARRDRGVGGGMGWRGIGARAAAVLIVLAGALSAGCGDDDDGDMTACESAATDLCERACGCGPCALAGGDGSTIQFDDLAACLQLSRTLGCGENGQGTPGNDYAGCEAALPAAMCVARTDTMGNPIMALEVPPACN